jgi:hypothetical protein
MRAKKWEVRIFCHIIQLLAFNAHVLYKSHFSLERGHRGYRFKNFLEEVARGLCNVGHGTGHLIAMEEEEDDGTPAAVAKRRLDEGDAEDNVSIRKHIRLGTALEMQSCQTIHHPVKWGRKEGKDERPYCKICAKRSSYSCESCRVGLCLHTDPNNANAVCCWKSFHTL